MHCNGHCFLSKQLKKAEEQGKKQAQNVLKEKIEIIADRYVECGSMHFPAYISYEFPTCPNQLHVSEFFNSLLKPPGV